MFYTNESLSTNQLAYMHAAAQAERREILSEEYPQWSLAREEIVKTIKQHNFERPTVSRKRKRTMPGCPQESLVSQDAELQR